MYVCRQKPQKATFVRIAISFTYGIVDLGKVGDKKNYVGRNTASYLLYVNTFYKLSIDVRHLGVILQKRFFLNIKILSIDVIVATI
jgi:hypothetical protein